MFDTTLQGYVSLMASICNQDFTMAIAKLLDEVARGSFQIAINPANNS
jgi:hypothetical protein